jgi:hypothetical protein
MSVPVVPGVPTSSPAPAPAAAPVSSTGLRLAGQTYNQAGVARLLTRLATVPTLTGIQLVSSTTVEKGSKHIIQFEISASLRGAGEAS